MNKKGKMLFVFLAIFYFIFGMIIYQFVKPDIAIARNSDNLKCSLPDTDGDRIVCLLIDGVIPILIIGILAVTAGLITDGVIK